MKQPKYKHIALVGHLKRVENASLHKCAFERGQANCLWRPHLSTSFWQSWPRSGCYEKPAGSWYGQCETVSPSKLHIDLVRLTQLLVICSIFPPPINRGQNGFICSPVLALIWQNCPSFPFLTFKVSTKRSLFPTGTFQPCYAALAGVRFGHRLGKYKFSFTVRWWKTVFWLLLFVPDRGHSLLAGKSRSPFKTMKLKTDLIMT